MQVAPDATDSYDLQFGGVNWYCLLPQGNPDPRMAEMADVFMEWVASRLRVPRPRIYWFERVSTTEAAAARVGCIQRQEDPGHDPLSFDCPYFMLKGNRGDLVAGFTHATWLDKVCVQARMPDFCTLRAMADECYHIYQGRLPDGIEWKHANHKFAEEEAAAFADSLATLIRRFLECWPDRRSQQG
jgi:hypothetical protein